MQAETEKSQTVIERDILFPCVRKLYIHFASCAIRTYQFVKHALHQGVCFSVQNYTQLSTWIQGLPHLTK